MSIYSASKRKMRLAKAYEAVALGHTTGLLHGVPVNVKESFAVEG
ncbi:MAG: amidase [Acidobacteriota bacterium]|nr:amidase [Acidobacteriota bacterium]